MFGAYRGFLMVTQQVDTRGPRRRSPVWGDDPVALGKAPGCVDRNCQLLSGVQRNHGHGRSERPLRSSEQRRSNGEAQGPQRPPRVGAQGHQVAPIREATGPSQGPSSARNMSETAMAQPVQCSSTGWLSSVSLLGSTVVDLGRERLW